MLVWLLSPEEGVDVRLTDYGASQFTSPSGLLSMKGTEEYMAPELGKFGEHSFYDEKVGGTLPKITCMNSVCIY